MRLRQFFGWLAVVACCLLSACVAPRSQEPADPLAALRQPDGSVVWQDEYRFSPPAPPWQLIDLDEDDYAIAFLKMCEGTTVDYPCQSTLAYAEEPFGYSRDFEQRQQEFFKRFLWASRVVFDEPRLKKVQALGQDALEAVIEGIEPVKKHKVWAKVIFARRGDRVVAFYYTQWRQQGKEYDGDDVAVFDRFVESFGYQKPSFYQRLLGGDS